MAEKVIFNDFQKLDLRVGKILEVNDHKNADKLFILSVDLGEKKPRQIVAGLKPYYSKSELVGKIAVFIANLDIVKIRGVESNGMILAADNGGNTVVFLAPEKVIEVGSRIR